MLSFRIALRYLFSSKAHSVVNLISIVSVFAILVPISAMIFILSMNNGLISLIDNLYSSFDSELRISSSESFFSPTSESILAIGSIAGVEALSLSVEQSVLLDYNGVQYPAILKGVDSSYHKVVPFADLLTHGSYEFGHGDFHHVIVGQGIAYNMKIHPVFQRPLNIYSLSSSESSIFTPVPQFRQSEAFPTAVYELDMDMDSRYLFSDLEFAQGLINNGGQISAIELKLSSSGRYAAVRSAVQNILGPDIVIKDRYEQRGSLYRMINIEKWIIAMMLIIITTVSSMSLVGSLVMLNSEKRNQNRVLLYLGYTDSRIRWIFILLGMIMSILGIFLGIFFGVLFSFLQQEYGILNMGGDTMLFESYPVEVQLRDIVIVGIATTIVAFMISYFTVKNLETT